MPRLEVSRPFGVWSHQLLMNVNIDARVFNLHVYLSAVCLTFQGRTRGINFQPGVRPNSGRSRSIFMALSLFFFWVFVTTFSTASRGFYCLVYYSVILRLFFVNRSVGFMAVFVN